MTSSCCNPLNSLSSVKLLWIKVPFENTTYALKTEIRFGGIRKHRVPFVKISALYCRLNPRLTTQINTSSIIFSWPFKTWGSQNEPHTEKISSEFLRGSRLLCGERDDSHSLPAPLPLDRHSFSAQRMEKASTARMSYWFCSEIFLLHLQPSQKTAPAPHR